MSVRREPPAPRFAVGDPVRRGPGASYTFPGEVRAVFTTRAGLVRYVVEHDTERGMLHVFSEESLERRVDAPG